MREERLRRDVLARRALGTHVLVVDAVAAAPRAAHPGPGLVVDALGVQDLGVEGRRLIDAERRQRLAQLGVRLQHVVVEPVAEERGQVVDGRGVLAVGQAVQGHVGDARAAVRGAHGGDRGHRAGERGVVDIDVPAQAAGADQVAAVEAAEGVADEVHLVGAGLGAHLFDAFPEERCAHAWRLERGQGRQEDLVPAGLAHGLGDAGRVAEQRRGIDAVDQHHREARRRVHWLGGGRGHAAHAGQLAQRRRRVAVDGHQLRQVLAVDTLDHRRHTLDVGLRRQRAVEADGVAAQAGGQRCVDLCAAALLDVRGAARA
ncbi:MAG: hypothetical protein WKG00_05675 [Polyangiaceae bacterium]